MGECDKNANYMLKTCKKSCDICKDKKVTTTAATTTAAATESIEDVSRMLKRTTKFGELQVAKGNFKEKTLTNVQEMIDYMEKSDAFLALPSKVQENCRNKVCNL